MGDYTNAQKEFAEQLKLRTQDEVRRILDAKVEALWQLGEPTGMRQIRTIGNIAAVSDLERNIADEAVFAIAEKYGLKKHDLYMFYRAHQLLVFHGMCKGIPQRIELFESLVDRIRWQ